MHYIQNMNFIKQLINNIIVFISGLIMLFFPVGYAMIWGKLFWIYWCILFFILSCTFSYFLDEATKKFDINGDWENQNIKKESKDEKNKYRYWFYFWIIVYVLLFLLLMEHVSKSAWYCEEDISYDKNYNNDIRCTNWYWDVRYVDMDSAVELDEDAYIENWILQHWWKSIQAQDYT